MYDNNGDLFGFIYNGTEYYYVKNLQNDVTAITDSNGNIIVNYYYDAWGNPTGTTGNAELAEINPIRYRSYYFDEETGFYYLNSRYYAPTIGRFLNADESDYLGADGSQLSYNLFTYCGNNPITGYDPYGTFDFWKLAKGIGRIITGIAAVAAGVAVCIAGAPVAMIAVAAVTIVAGVLTAVNGAADIQQSVTRKNFVRDKVFKGSQKSYDIYSGVTEITAVVRTAICGNYLMSTE